MTENTPVEREKFDRWRVLRDLQIRLNNLPEHAKYASHPDNKAWADIYYAQIEARWNVSGRGEYPAYVAWREAGDAHAAKMGNTLDQAIAAAEANYQEAIDGEFAEIVDAEIVDTDDARQTEYEIHYTTDVANGHVVIDRPDTYADCLSVLDGIVKALETVPGMHAQIEPTTPYAQLFVYGMTSNGWARIGRYTIAGNDHDSR